jgi:hypothetical protein
MDTTNEECHMSTEITQEWASPIDTTSFEIEAKESFEQHRLKDCVQQINHLLTISPDNDVAHTLRASVNEELDGFLNEVRALMEERKDVGSLQGRLCGAEVLLRKVLDIDPSHKGATALLQVMKMMASKAEPVATPVSKSEVIPFTVAPGPEKKKQDKKSVSFKAIAVAVIAVAAGGFLLFGTQQSSPTAKPAQTAKVPAAPARQNSIPAAPPAAPMAQAPVTPQPVLQSIAESTARPAPDKAAAASVVVTAKRQQVAPAQFGSLAISSPVATDVYSGDQLLGSTPLTIQLPPGNQTLEFRHGDLRKTATQFVKADETITTLVTFDAVVQVNAKPWANVFVDGSERQALGQTPLSDVHVPIGKVLIFENPKFPTKTYRVTGKESAIQIVFP